VTGVQTCALPISGRSPLAHADGHEPGDPLGEPGPLDRLHDLVDVLVGERRLLGEAPGRPRPHLDADGGELALLLASRGALAGRGAAHGPAGAVARRVERVAAG